MHRLLSLLIGLACTVSLAACIHGGAVPTDPPLVIIDTDFNTMGDDGQLLAMAVQLQAEHKLTVLGVTVVSGNQWLQQEVADALKALQRLGADDRIGVYAGANRPMSHDLAAIRSELAAGAGGDGYLGAWSRPEPLKPGDLTAPPDGFAEHSSVRGQSAVEFIIDRVKAHPHQVTILAIGPLTNLARALQQAPEIAPLIGQLIIMGGAFAVPGNTTRAAEFNWWFDPLAAQIVLRQPIARVAVVPLDVTDTVLLTRPVYDRIAHAPRPTAVTTLYRQLIGYGFDGKNGFETNPAYTQSIWDTLTLAYLIDPAFATRTEPLYADVISATGPDNGRAIGSAQASGAGSRAGSEAGSQAGAGAGAATTVPLRRITVIQRFDQARFFEFYVDLLTRPVPVDFSGSERSRMM